MTLLHFRQMARRFPRVALAAVTGIVLTAGIALPVSAHHSAAFFDFTKNVAVEGVVKEMRVENPHTVIVLSVTDASGNAKDITFAGHSRNNVYRRGWRPDMLGAGDKVTIHIAPTRDGSDGGYIHSFTLADGREF